MKTIILTLALLVAATSTVKAQDTKPQNTMQIDRPTLFLVGVGGVLALGEMTASEACIQQGSCFESNPVHPGGTGPWDTASRAFIKGGAQFGASWLILRAGKVHPDYPNANRRKWIARSMAVGMVVFNGYLMKRALDLQHEGINP